MRNTNDDANVISRQPAAAPDWTDSNTHDPGIMVLGLFAFLTTGLLYAAGRPGSGRAQRWAGAVVVGLGAAAGTTWMAKSRSTRDARVGQHPPAA